MIIEVSLVKLNMNKDLKLVKAYILEKLIN